MSVDLSSIATLGLVDSITLVMSGLFLLVVLSYYVVLILPRRKDLTRMRFGSLTIIVPARNEAPYIAECLQSLQRAAFSGRKQIIVVDDASHDSTAAIAKLHGVEVLRNNRQLGKSASINRALKRANGELIAIVDGDSIIAPDALMLLAKELSKKNMGAAAAVVKVRNKSRFINPWVHLELMYSSFIRSILARIDANTVTPGALSMYRREALDTIGGFSVKGFSEDVDVAVRLLRSGYRVGFCDRAISETYMPETIKSFFRQRTRVARGLINILKRHVQFNSALIDLYAMPLLMFTYVQSVIMGIITIYKVTSGYFLYFADKGIYLSWDVVKFFIEWFSLIGFVKWTWNVFSGNEPLTIVAMIGIISTLLSYPLFLYAIVRYDKGLQLSHIIPFVFMFPYWLLLMLIYLICMPEVFFKDQHNMWKKNEK